MYEQFLKKVPLFSDLPDNELDRLCIVVRELNLTAGEILFEEGSQPDRTYIIHSGELEIIRIVDGREVLINVLHKPGTIIGEMAMLADTPRLATVRARKDSFLLYLGDDWLYQLMSLSPKAARILLRTAARRWGGLEDQTRHSRRMAQLSVISAGLAHELNNPAAAATRAASQLQAALENAQQTRAALERLDLTEAQQAEVTAAGEWARRAAEHPPILDALTRSDQEEVAEAWLEAHSVADGWRLAPTLVDLALDDKTLDRLSEQFDRLRLDVFLNWLESSYNMQLLINEIALATGRVSEIVGALKSYVFLDQAPMQEVDVHAGLEDALIVLSQKLTGDVTIQREYDPDLPRITAYGSDLNQVWTSLIDNAIDALRGQGRIILRTQSRQGGIIVEIEDNGIGIAPADLPKVFDPFYTTKPPGQGTGLGLSMCYNIIAGRHHGDIAASSEPGRTIFRVELPLSP